MSNVEKDFRTELRALLSKYTAELTAEDHYPGYPECGEDVRMTASIPSVWDKETGEVFRERVEVDLGRFQDGTTKDLTTA